MPNGNTIGQDNPIAHASYVAHRIALLDHDMDQTRSELWGICKAADYVDRELDGQDIDVDDSKFRFAAMLTDNGVVDVNPPGDKYPPVEEYTKKYMRKAKCHIEHVKRLRPVMVALRKKLDVLMQDPENVSMGSIDAVAADYPDLVVDVAMTATVRGARALRVSIRDTESRDVLADFFVKRDSSL